MGSRERERDREHQTHQVSSMVVRPAESGGGGGGTSDYEPGEVRRVDNHNDNSFYSRSERFHDNQPLAFEVAWSVGSGFVENILDHMMVLFLSGYGMRAGSVSPLLQRKNDQYYGSDFDHPGGPRRGRGFRGGRGSGRFRDFSPPYGRGRGSRSYGRGFDVPSFEPGPFRGEGLPRNNPNVSPREGDWICSDPACGNLNFARRSHCNNCNKVRYGPGSGPIGSPQRRFPGPSPPRGVPRIRGPPMDRGPRRDMNGYGSSPLRGWGRDDPREFGMGPPPARHGGRFPDNHLPRERPGYHEEDDYRERGKFDRSMPPDWGPPRDQRDDFFDDRRGYSGRGTQGPPPLSPPPPPPLTRGNWSRDIRERSRSPLRGPLKDYHRDSYMGRGRVDRRGIRRERVNSSF